MSEYRDNQSHLVWRNNPSIQAMLDAFHLTRSFENNKGNVAHWPFSLILGILKEGKASARHGHIINNT